MRLDGWICCLHVGEAFEGFQGLVCAAALENARWFALGVLHEELGVVDEEGGCWGCVVCYYGGSCGCGCGGLRG